MTLTLTAIVIGFAMTALFLVVLLAMLCTMVRLIKGPAAQDRVLALDCMVLNGMLAMLVLSLVHGNRHYFEAALLIALLRFVSTTAMAKFLLRGEVIE